VIVTVTVTVTVISTVTLTVTAMVMILATHGHGHGHTVTDNLWIPPDSVTVTWSGGAVGPGNISCRGSLNHGRRSSPGVEGEGRGCSMNSSILINYP
jgi:hypothetical protein